MIEEKHPDEELYRTVNIKITLEDEDDMTYSVSCPEWVYIMPTKNPDKIVQSIVNSITAHNAYTKALKVETSPLK